LMTVLQATIQGKGTLERLASELVHRLVS